MDPSFILTTFILLMAIAFLYSAVGHAGASGYLAVMALLSFPIDAIKPTSLVLNIIVSAIASYKFIKAGYFNKKVFTSFVVTSIPFSFLGGYMNIDAHWFKIAAGVFLIVSGALLLIKEYIRPRTELQEVSLPFALVTGAFIGLVSGLIGVGGGVFLSPVIIMLGYARIKDASGIAALFILCNSVLGLSGHYLSLKVLDLNILYWITAVAIGGYIGSHLGSRRFNNKYILMVLFVVLISAGLKFILVG